MPQERGWLVWRVSALAAATLLILCPLLAPFVELLFNSRAWAVWSEWDRLLPLLTKTLLVIVGSITIALVLGGSAAFLLVRTKVPGSRVWSLLLALGLFVPLPLFTCGWFLLVQFVGWPLPALWPPETRLVGAAWLHGLLGVPWAALILGLGLAWVEPELEETARLEGTLPAVFRRVIWPRCRPFVGLAALVVAWTTWHEIVVTDFFKVNTLAEEVYLQLNGGGSDEVARATAATLPWCIVLAWLCSRSLRTWRRQCPPRWPTAQQLKRIPLGRYRWLAATWLFVVTLCVLFVPLLGLIAKAGMVYEPSQSPSWSAGMLFERLRVAILDSRWMLIQSLTVGLLTGLLTAATVLLLIWLTRRSPRTESVVWGFMSLLWSVPGPLLGLGLLTVIQFLIATPGGALWSTLLYSHPSPLPNIWSAWLRFLPLAWAAMWPVARLVPAAWEEMAMLEGATPWRRLRVIYWPVLAWPLLWLTLAVGVLSLGEISASKLITTPGYTPLSHHIFQQLHSGMDTEVAALSLTLMLPVLLGGLLIALWRPAHSLSPPGEGRGEGFFVSSC